MTLLYPFFVCMYHRRSQRRAWGPSPPPSEWEKNIKASLVNLTLNMRYKNDKNINFVITIQIRFFQAQTAPKSVFGRGSARTPLGELTTLPQTGWRGGYPLPIPLPARRLRRLELGASVLRPPSTQNPGYASGMYRCMIQSQQTSNNVHQ